MAFIDSQGNERDSQAGVDAAEARYKAMGMTPKQPAQTATPASSIVNPQTNTNATVTQNTAATQAKADASLLPAISSSGGYIPTTSTPSPAPAAKTPTAPYQGPSVATATPTYDANALSKMSAPPTTGPAGEVYTDAQKNILKQQWEQLHPGQTASTTGTPSITTGMPTADGSAASSAAIADTANSGAMSVDQQTISDQLDANKEAQAGAIGFQFQTEKELAEAKYEAEQRNLNEMQKLADDALVNRNAALEKGAQQQRTDAQIAMDFATTQADLQRQRSLQTYNNQIVEQKVANTKRTLQEESRIAALGGFGSSTSRNQQIETTTNNDRLLNNLVFQKDISDKEISAQLDNIHKEYVSNLNKIEVAKQTAIQENYDKYLQYVADIQKSKDMSEQAKAAAIKAAAANYKTQISQISNDSFKQRYDISIQLADRAKEELNNQKTDARATLTSVLTAFASSDQEMSPAMLSQVATLEKQAGFPIGTSLAQLDALKKSAAAQNLAIETEMNDKGDMTVYAVDKTTGAVKNQTVLSGIGKITEEKGHWKFEKNDYGQTIAFNELTGETKNMGKSWEPSNFGNAQSGGYSTGNATWSTPAGTVAVGSLAIPEDKFNKIFNVGGYGGQCGTWATTQSTAPRVGNTWNEKARRIDKQTDPKPGDKLLIPLLAGSDGTGSGHVALVVSYNAGTGDIGVVESNMDKKGTIRKSVYNINALKAKYDSYAKHEDRKSGRGGDMPGWGFASGELRPEVKAKLEAAAAGTVTTIGGTIPQPQTRSLSNDGVPTVRDLVNTYGITVKDAQERLNKILDEKLKTKSSSSGDRDPLLVSDTNPFGFTKEAALKASEPEKAWANFGQGLINAEEVLKSYDNANVKTSLSTLQQMASSSQGKDEFGAGLGAFLQGIQSADERAIMQTRMLWVQNKLRKESGAAISPSEYYTGLMTYFPSSDASKKDITDKQNARRGVINQYMKNAGPAAANVELFTPAEYNAADNTPGLGGQITDNIQSTVQNAGSSIWDWASSLNQPQIDESDINDINNM